MRNYKTWHQISFQILNSYVTWLIFNLNGLQFSKHKVNMRLILSTYPGTNNLKGLNMFRVFKKIMWNCKLSFQNHIWLIVRFVGNFNSVRSYPTLGFAHLDISSHPCSYSYSYQHSLAFFGNTKTASKRERLRKPALTCFMSRKKQHLVQQESI